jgi:Cys-rich protein (TIGR01571 family)
LGYLGFDDHCASHPNDNDMEQQQQQQQPHPLPLQLRGSINYLTGGPPAAAPPINFDTNMSYGVHHHGQSTNTPQQPVGLGNHYNYFPQQYPNCLITHFCPWYTFGQIAEIVDEGTTSCCAASLLYLGVQCWLGCCFTPMVSYVYRSKIRRKFNIPPGRCCGDFCLHFWCECFALRQVMPDNPLRFLPLRQFFSNRVYEIDTLDAKSCVDQDC